MTGRLMVKRGGRRESIYLGDIIFMEKDQRKIIIHMSKGNVSFYGRYKDIEENLDDRFTCPHRSYIINMEHISMIMGDQVIMETGGTINLCKKCMDRLKKSYDIYVAKNLANT